MKVGAAIYNLLTTDAAVSALVGTRVFPELAVEGGEDPYIVYSVVSNTPVDTKDKAPVDEAQIEVFSVANTYAKANDLADKVRAALSRKGKVVYDTVTVQSIQYTNEVVEVTPERDFYICVQDYTVRTGEVVPELLLNTYTGALLALSLRRVRGEYRGPLIEVRRASDNATLEIGYNSANTLDTATLQTFCAGTDGYVRTWFDQSGNGYNAVETNVLVQGKIVENGSVLQNGNGNNCVRFDAFDGEGTDRYKNITPTIDTAPNSSFIVAQHEGYNDGLGDSDRRQIFAIAPDGGTAFHHYEVIYWNVSKLTQTFIGDGTTGTGYNNNADPDADTHLITNVYNGVELKTALDGTLTRTVAVTETSAGVVSLGHRNNSVHNMSEFILYTSDKIADRTGIEANINTHYNIF